MIIRNLTELKDIISGLHNTGKKIVSTNGCFDIMHPGHIENFKVAKELGDVLIVLVNSDKNHYFKTKPGRPINNEETRLIMLDAIKYVDLVFLFDEETPVGILEEIKPDLHIKGGDYKKEHLPEFEVIKKNGGDLKIIKTVDGYSTTDTIGKILKVYSKVN